MLDNFERYALRGPSIGMAYNAGIIDLHSAIGLIDDAHKFKEWVSGLAFEADLLTEYIRKMSEEPLLEKFPGRELKFAALSGANAGIGALLAGPVGLLTGLGLGAFETYILNYIVKRQRPTTFIEQLENRIGDRAIGT